MVHVIKIISHHCHHWLLILGVQIVAGHQYETACHEINICTLCPTWEKVNF